MEIEFAPKALEDLKYWKLSGNLKIQKKISQLLKAIKSDPYTGIGKPEQLKYNLSGCWSRRINDEHRMVYEVKGDVVYILSLRYHYQD